MLQFFFLPKSIDDPTTYNGKQEASGERQTELVASSLCLGSKVQLSESGIGNLLLRDGEAYLKIAINRGACNKSNRVKGQNMHSFIP